MEEVLEKLETTIITSNNDENKTNFDGMYKNWGKLGNQEQRRKDILETQKDNRNNKLDNLRGIVDLVTSVEQNQVFQNQRVNYRPKIYVAGFTKTSVTYKNVLMLSEWMIEKPEDFSENWYVVPCPKGVRVLLVAGQGITKCYTKYGQFRFECRTSLPGGNPCENIKNRCCVLDGLYIEATNTVYLLDLLAWNNQPMTDGETEFRHFWLQSQLAEISGLTILNKRNKLLFQILPKVPCDKESFNAFMMTYPQFEDSSLSLDGLLFYHKKAHYVSGETPLVGWLYPYMVPEVLGADVTVNPNYMAEKPPTYQYQAMFIELFQEKYAKKWEEKLNKRRSPRSSMMDTAHTEQLAQVDPSSHDVMEYAHETKERRTKKRIRPKRKEKIIQPLSMEANQSEALALETKQKEKVADDECID